VRFSIARFRVFGARNTRAPHARTPPVRTRAHIVARVARAPGGVRFRARYLLSQKGIDWIDPAYYTPAMAMGRRKDRARTPGLWIATNELPPTGGHPFYQRLNQVLDTHGFDEFVEAQCASFYAATRGRPSLTPGTYFRLLLIGYFEGIDSERGIAWRTADSLALRGFLGLGVDEAPPEHSTISRTRRLIVSMLAALIGSRSTRRRYPSAASIDRGALHSLPHRFELLPVNVSNALLTTGC
jgi:transposase